MMSMSREWPAADELGELGGRGLLHIGAIERCCLAAVSLCGRGCGNTSKAHLCAAPAAGARAVAEGKES